MVESYGAGIALDKNLDMQIDPTGDIDEEQGISELQKDISWQSTFSLRRFLGERPTKNVEVQALNVAQQVAESDSRVRRVLLDESDATLLDGGERLQVELRYVTNAGEERLFVYEV